MELDAARARRTRGVVLVFVVLTIAAVASVVAFPQITARFAERRTADEATEIGDALMERYNETQTFPRKVVGDNTDGNRPEVLADGRPLPGVTLAPGMSIYYYSSESRNLGIGFCLEHRTGSGEPNAFAAYGISAETTRGRIGQTGHGNGCMSAE